MREFVRENKTFDFVINDLTDIVIQSDEQDGKSFKSHITLNRSHNQ